MKHSDISDQDIAQKVIRDARWQQILVRDPVANGQFFYSVKTTGIYCRPTCGARPPRPENVQFHATVMEAEEAGFKPCKRCRPHQQSLSATHADKVEQACRMIESAERTPTLSTLAAQAGLSAYHFHRLFKSVTGITPRAYAHAHKAQTVRRELSAGMKVTDAIYAAGYESNSRFYQNSNQMLGMKPKQYVKGGANVDIRFALAECVLGSILVASSDKGICAISIGDHADMLLRELQDQFPHAKLVGGDAAYEAMVADVVRFIQTPGLGLDLPLDIQGTAFQQRVWQVLRQIPCGTTVTYSELARKMGMPGAVRAIANACAANTLAVVIPCHRVVRLDGSLSGYRWGIARKKVLIALEAAVVATTEL